ncbi:hypothetical protein BGZ61DRAFT_442356 [Ilyonectria robusta]|uniref:uncharacterized protein n=1 Tax=Ilyonectria robusta TaxID=1079257 RepID=UPI001E8CBAAC|nr:uncharacterized protein BGZ61DRAFT_442356 [Ilyonectria robusta]KAH8734294.1 hypothetical protein BGZ61DRAFT_442356 [Ilyonectria robusta]
MKFSNVLFFATAALAAPTIQALDKRQTTVLGTVQSIANTITNSTSGNVANIKTIIVSIQNNVAADVLVQLQLQLEANLQAIVTVLSAAAVNITDATNAAAIEIGGDVDNLTTAQILQIKAAIESAVAAVNNVTATVTASVSVLTPGGKKLIADELKAIRDAVNGILTPLAQFLQASSPVRRAFWRLSAWPFSAFPPRTIRLTQHEEKGMGRWRFSLDRQDWISFIK